ncbi:MAG: cytochrome-c peroxidase, partial [Pseudorhodobacter sp.]
SNAIAAFISFEWRSDSAPFDAWMRGEAPLPALATQGAELFYGKAGCSACHSGPLLTDQAFHAMASPQLGPGKTERFETNQRDIGRMRVTNRADDIYAFRTPSLRNVIATAPYGHAGGHADLRAFLRFHADPVAGLQTYTPQAVLPAFTPAKDDWAIVHDKAEAAAIQKAVKQPANPLTDTEADAILAFLESLTDPVAIAGRLGIPASVPSGLPIDR